MRRIFLLFIFSYNTFIVTQKGVNSHSVLSTIDANCAYCTYIA